MKRLLLGLIALALTAAPAAAQSLTFDLGAEGGGSVSNRVIQLVLLIAVLSLAPSILVMMTAFTRIIVVLSLVRSALGLQQSPPNAVMVSLAMFLTFFVMAPTLQKAYDTGLRPMVEEEMSVEDGLSAAIGPMKDFMLAHTRDKDLGLFVELAGGPPPKTKEEASLRVVVPAFMISELRVAFEIGFLLFLPFLIIDMVVASILMSMGMMMLPPAMIALPFKLIFFVLVDGWYLLAGTIVRGYGVG